MYVCLVFVATSHALTTCICLPKPSISVGKSSLKTCIMDACFCDDLFLFIYTANTRHAQKQHGYFTRSSWLVALNRRPMWDGWKIDSFNLLLTKIERFFQQVKSRSPLHDNSSDERHYRLMRMAMHYYFRLKLKRSVLSPHMCIWPFTETLDLSLLNLVAGMATYGTVRVVQAHGLAFGTDSLCLHPIHGRVIAVQVQWNPHLRETRQLRWQNTALKSGGAPKRKSKDPF